MATESIVHWFPYHTKRDSNQVTQFTALALETVTVGDSVTASNYSSWGASRQTSREFRLVRLQVWQSWCFSLLVYFWRGLGEGFVRQWLRGHEESSCASANSAFWVMAKGSICQVSYSASQVSVVMRRCYRRIHTRRLLKQLLVVVSKSKITVRWFMVR